MGDACLPDLLPLDVAVAVIQRDGRFLIAQRLPNDSFGGYWEFPGGKLVSGETLESGLAREILEELGVRVEVGSKRMVIEHNYPARTIRLHCFECRLVEGEPRAIECTEWRWVVAAELDRFQFPPASQPLIKNLQADDGL